MSKLGIYLDNTATTRTRPEVVSVVRRYLDDVYANPSSAHASGMTARGSVEMARERIARTLHCASGELVFTGSGSEANNLALRGVLKASAGKSYIVSSRIEHSSILNTCADLERDGVEVAYVDVDRRGRYDLDALKKAIRAETKLVSLSWVNNEIGTVQDVEAIRDIAKGAKVLLHLDAVQALPYFAVDLATLGADLVSFSGHKLYAPKGVGLLYVRRGTPIRALVSGGEQEFGLRSGTENVAYIVGLSKAILLNHEEKRGYRETLAELRDALIDGVLKTVPDSILTGDPLSRAPNLASFCFRGINGRRLVKELSWRGFEVSSGSACSSPKNEPSHVLRACGIGDDYVQGSMRVSLGRYNRAKDVTAFLRVLPKLVLELRDGDRVDNNAAAFISQEEFREKISSGKDLQILDVRPVNYPDYHLAGSLFMPRWKLEKHWRELDPSKETVVICHQGDVVAPEAQQLLLKHGFSDVRVLKGGLFSYLDDARFKKAEDRFG